MCRWAVITMEENHVTINEVTEDWIQTEQDDVFMAHEFERCREEAITFAADVMADLRDAGVEVNKVGLSIETDLGASVKRDWYSEAGVLVLKLGGPDFAEFQEQVVSSVAG